MRYTKNGTKLLAPGCHLVINGQYKYFCTDADLLNLGYYPYKIVEGQGEDGVVNGQWVHYTEPLNDEYYEPEE